MKKIIKTVVTSLLLATIAALLAFNGCSSYTPSPMPWTGITPENLTQQQWQDILKVTLEYHEHLETYKSGVVTSVNTDVAGGPSPWKSTLNTGISSARNIKENKIQMTLNMSIIMEGMGQTGEEQNVIYDMVAPDDWVYISMASLEMGSYWVKVKRSGELEENLNLNTVEREMKLLASPSNISYLRTEKVNNIDCYVLSITPNNTELAKWLKEEAASGQNLDWEKAISDTGIYEGFNLYCYLAKDSYLVMRMAMNMIIKLTPELAGATSLDYDTMQLSVNMDLILYDLNVPVDIMLPADAFTANEVSADIFSS